MIEKKYLSERDIVTKFIIPAIEESGWNKQTQLREEVSFTNGRIFVKGKKTKRGEKKRADIILYYKPNIPVAVVEAKDNKHSVGDGMQQALDYAETLDIPVAISSNGDGFLIQYRKNCGPLDSNNNPIIIENADLNHFPTAEELWNCYKKYNKIENSQAEETTLSSYFFDSTGRSPRYYQRIAINRTVEAIARGQNRILLVMATGTGKTYTSFQIIYRLWKSGCKKRILYLADRNNLIIQTKKGDFKHFKDKLTIIKVGGKIVEDNWLTENLPFLLSDTVGFIRKLPTELVESFKSTLDEVREADLLLHVVDISHPDFEEQIQVVERTLGDLGCSDKPSMIIFNKIDAYTYVEKDEDDLTPRTKENITLPELMNTWMAKMNGDCIFISAREKTNLEELKTIIYNKVRELHVQKYPYNDFLYQTYDTEEQ